MQITRPGDRWLFLLKIHVERGDDHVENIELRALGKKSPIKLHVTMITRRIVARSKKSTNPDEVLTATDTLLIADGMISTKVT